MDINMGDTFQKTFMYTQEDVNKFAELVGDNNPIHLDEEYAKETIFGRRIIHGMLSASIFSKIFGTIWPGEGTVYVSQSLKFLAPMYTHVPYVATCQVISVVKNKAEIKTEVVAPLGAVTIEGIAKIRLP